ncbi:MAG: PAS domain S-box protein [Cyclobacteriaceae bacterium]|nr:PAS domain S-box protein [Cyclobacteriaceae bacterium]
MELSFDKVEHEKYQQQFEAYKEEIKLLKNELNRYKTSADSANDGLWDFDLITNTNFISVPWKTMLGYDIDEELELDGLWGKLLHPEDKKYSVKKFDDFKEGKFSSFDEKFRLLHKNGTYRWIRSRAKNIKNKAGKVIRLSGSHTDITEMKEAEDALKESEKKYKSLFQNSLVGMCRFDLKEEKVLESNCKIWEIVGVQNSNYKGIICSEYYKNPKDKEKFIEILLKEGKIEHFEVELVRADGKPIWVLISSKLYAEGYMESIVIDITDRKKAVLELKKVNFELDNFVYHASHDLRSPLSSMLGLLNIYKQETDAVVQEECIYRIEKSVKRLDDFIGDLLSISRNDRVNDPYIPINFLVEISESLNSYFSGINMKRIDIHVRVRQPIPFVSDLTRVRAILNNIIFNAIKYRDLEKPLSIIQIDVEVNKKEALLRVEDNGLGIDKNKINKIFDMFYQAHEESKGSGLGLYIVKNVAEKLSGSIEVKTEKNKGSTFSVVLPNSYSDK